LDKGFTLKTYKQRIRFDNEARSIEFYNRLLPSRQLKHLKAPQEVENGIVLPQKEA
jgi:hypothetical protein